LRGEYCCLQLYVSDLHHFGAVGLLADPVSTLVVGLRLQPICEGAGGLLLEVFEQGDKFLLFVDAVVELGVSPAALPQQPLEVASAGHLPAG
jgi:hypothetical protein